MVKSVDFEKLVRIEIDLINKFKENSFFVETDVTNISQKKPFSMNSDVATIFEESLCLKSDVINNF